MINSEEKKLTYLQKYQEDTRKTLKVLEEMEDNPKLLNNFNEMLSETVKRSFDLEIAEFAEENVKYLTEKLLTISKNFPEKFQDAYWNSVALVYRNYRLEFISLPFVVEKEIESFIGKSNLESFLECVEKESVWDYYSFLLDIFQPERVGKKNRVVLSILASFFDSFDEYAFVLDNNKKEFSWLENDPDDDEFCNFIPPQSQIVLILKTIINSYQVDENFYLWSKLFRFIIKSLDLLLKDDKESCYWLPPKELSDVMSHQLSEEVTMCLDNLDEDFNIEVYIASGTLPLYPELLKFVEDRYYIPDDVLEKVKKD